MWWVDRDVGFFRERENNESLFLFFLIFQNGEGSEWSPSLCVCV